MVVVSLSQLRGVALLGHLVGTLVGVILIASSGSWWSLLLWFLGMGFIFELAERSPAKGWIAKEINDVLEPNDG